MPSKKKAKKKATKKPAAESTTVSDAIEKARPVKGDPKRGKLYTPGVYGG